ncbi:GlxA family transcriptional regulator [Oceanicaulis sp. LC35]|uniref:GlxA family transcriptional regulator n=1 Tax=Oceanicaulis sp. LC35 TaxID=3349635 RepID=UPI003F8753BA
MSSFAPARTVCFVIYPGFELLDLTGPYSVLASAARLAPRLGWTLCIAAPESGLVTSGHGVSIQADHALSDLETRSFHSLICIGGDPQPVQEIVSDPTFMASLRKAGAQAERQISICSGAYLLAEAGLARNRRLTTHWRAVRPLAERYPDVTVEPDAIHIQDGPVWSSAGVTAGIDLALALVEQEAGRDIALKIARNLLVPRLRSGGQSQYATDLAAQFDPASRLARVCEGVRKEPDADWSIDGMCARFHMSPRTLSRLTRSELNLSPAQLVERLRLDLARSLLVETDRHVTDIADLCGFGSLQRLDRAFLRQIGVSPRDFRARFRTPFPVETAS